MAVAGGASPCASCTANNCTEVSIPCCRSMQPYHAVEMRCINLISDSLRQQAKMQGGGKTGSDLADLVAALEELRRHRATDNESAGSTESALWSWLGGHQDDGTHALRRGWHRRASLSGYIKPGRHFRTDDDWHHFARDMLAATVVSDRSDKK